MYIGERCVELFFCFLKDPDGYTFVKDPDGYVFEILQKASTPEPLCHIMFRVGDLDHTVKFYEKVTAYRLCNIIFRVFIN